MKKIIYTGCFIFLSISTFMCGCRVAAQKQINANSSIINKPVVIKEIKSANNAVNQAPAECLKSFHDFFDYVQQPEPDIAKDQQAQIRFLSNKMQKAILRKIEIEDKKAKENPKDKREYPENGSFVGAWDYPTTYEIVGSRIYGEQAAIDVLYKWGENTEYAGNERLSSFIYKREGVLCKLEDIYTFDGAYNDAESLINYFRKDY